MSIRDFITIQKLGGGSFGQVQRVKRVLDSQEYALKKVKYMKLKEKDKKNAINQIRILASIDHPNVIKYKQAFFQENTHDLCTVMELAPNGDLASIIKDKTINHQTFYQSQIWTIGKDILYGIAVLHSKNIIHRDIKPANIFFGEGNVAKIGDFNVSLLLNQNFAYTQTGTPYYASPQIWNSQPYGFQCDIWSFGCVLYEMCCLKKPFQARNIDRLYQKVKGLKFDPLPYRFSYDISNVIQKCLTFKQKRIKVQQLKQIFQMHTPASYSFYNLPQQNSKKIIDPIEMPLNKKDFSQCLPKPKYENNEQKSLPRTQTSIQENPSILDRLMVPQKVRSKRSYLTKVRSQKLLLNYQQKQRAYCVQSPSFRNAIYLKQSPPPKSSVLIDAQQLSLRLKKLRIEMGY